MYIPGKLRSRTVEILIVDDFCAGVVGVELDCVWADLTLLLRVDHQRQDVRVAVSLEI